MGLWHTSCALSGLTLYDEEVRMGLVFLSTGLDPKNGSTTLNHDSRLRMVTPPLWGQYDGSGSVEPEGGVESACALSWLKSVVPKAKSLKDVQDACWNQRVKISKENFLYYTMVREDVWRTMTQQGEAIEPSWRSGVRLALEKLRKGGTFEEDDEVNMLMVLNGLYGFKMPTTISIAERWKKNKDDVTEAEVGVVADTLYVQLLMLHLRMEWAIGTGAGRQDDNHNFRKTWFDSMSAICDQSKANKERM